MPIKLEKDVNIAQIVEVLNRGGMVVYPTETVYGLGVDATNEYAVKKLSKYKNRPLGKPFSIAVVSQKMAEEYVELNDTARGLYKTFLPGPMTIISKSKIKNQRSKLAKGIASELGTVGIRISSYPLVTKIVKALGKPITATSANKSYGKRPYKISDLEIERFDLVIDAGELPHNEPSTVVDTTLDDIVTLRQGELVIGNKTSVVSRSEENTQNIAKELWQKYEGFAGQRAVVFALEGEMGAGKTVFTKGLARAMGIKENITSPTYSLEERYGTLVHIDAWRLRTSEELEQLGLGGAIGDKLVLAIEWADRVAEVIRKYNEEAVVVWVKIKYLQKESERNIEWGIL